MTGRKHLTFDYVSNYYKEQGCELLETEYVNCRTQMKYKCNCGNVSSTIYNKFQQGRRCKTCATNTRKYSLDEVINIFKQNDCILLDKTYNDVFTNLNYICSCGRNSIGTLHTISRGSKCKQCGVEKNTGKNHWNWKHEREKLTSIKRIRKSFSRKWALNNMQHDPNYNNYLITPEEYHIDHIIPITIFRDIMFEYDLDEESVRRVANLKENLQILPAKENMTKSAKGSIFEAAQYLMLNGIKLI